jgi:hypothetical protein
VAERDRLGERHVEPQSTGDRHRHLGHLEGVGQSGALVVVGEDEHLRLAGQATKGGGVQDAVTVAFETGPLGVGFLGAEPVAGAVRPGGAVGHPGVLGPFAGDAVGSFRGGGVAAGRCDAQRAARVSGPHLLGVRFEAVGVVARCVGGIGGDAAPPIVAAQRWVRCRRSTAGSPSWKRCSWRMILGSRGDIQPAASVVVSTFRRRARPLRAGSGSAPTLVR